MDRVREATDLVKLIGQYVALKPKGREYVGLCPFHDDHRPSMAVVTHKGRAFYNCFSCGKSGDCFTFVMDYHKMDFGDALRHLAENAGITLSRREPSAEASRGPRKTDLLAAVEYARDFFRRTLADEQLGADARNVIARRGISDEMTEHFQLGAAPDSFDGLQRVIAGRPASVRTAVTAGLLRERTGSEGTYDTFRNRLIFPICDEMGRPIAFGGRIIDPDDQPKYLNSPETPLFDKSRTLYGLHLARRAIIESQQAIVVEGYTDVIAGHQAGVTNVVATLGTALTKQHADVLARLADSVVLVFDADDAGRRAADRGVEVFFAAPVDVRICVLPEGQDPDTLLRADGGVEQFRSAVASAVDALAYKLERFESSLADATGISARQKRLEAFLTELVTLGFTAMDGVRKAMVLNRLAELTRVPVADIERALPRGRTVGPRSTGERPADTETSPTPTLLPAESAFPVSRARRIAEADVLGLLLFEPETAREVAEAKLAAKDFLVPEVRQVVDVVLPWLEETDGPEFSMSALLSRLADDQLRAAASRLYFEGQKRCGGDGDSAQQHMIEAATALRSRIETEQYEAQLAAGGPDGQQTGSADGDESEFVIERIRRRERQGNRPAAIWHGARG
ncbi:MAG: DNA primase [Planctomycetes bacterium]|nr:DNA primase [Planctomycetota bacterium]